jgi:hypothetical protein
MLANDSLQPQQAWRVPGQQLLRTKCLSAPFIMVPWSGAKANSATSGAVQARCLMATGVLTGLLSRKPELLSRASITALGLFCCQAFCSVAAEPTHPPRELLAE